ncbi:unnamed protein product, partial [Prorocentrum cordatum]
MERLRASPGPLLADWGVPPVMGALAGLLCSDDFCAAAPRRGSRAKKREYLNALARAGPLAWRRRVRYRVGCFFVEEKGSTLRLVIEARWANRACRAPPLSRLAVHGALARASARHESFCLMRGRHGRVIQACVASGVGASIGAAVSEACDDDLRTMDLVEASDVLEACFLGMAVGWSWALCFRNETISECMRGALREVGLLDVLVGGRRRPAWCGPRVLAVAPCVDGADVLALGRSEGRRIYEPVLAARRLSGDAVRVVCGHLCRRFGLRPPLLSILQRVYAFARGHLGAVAVLPADVWDELWVARATVPFADSDLGRPLRRAMWCSSASMHGCALHDATAGRAEDFDVGQWKERWGFREVLECVDRGPDAALAASALLTTDAGQ